jgi:hypothetical protein
MEGDEGKGAPAPTTPAAAPPAAGRRASARALHSRIPVRAYAAFLAAVCCLMHIAVGSYSCRPTGSPSPTAFHRTRVPYSSCTAVVNLPGRLRRQLQLLCTRLSLLARMTPSLHVAPHRCLGGDVLLDKGQHEGAAGDTAACDTLVLVCHRPSATKCVLCPRFVTPRTLARVWGVANQSPCP